MSNKRYLEDQNKTLWGGDVELDQEKIMIDRAANVSAYTRETGRRFNRYWFTRDWEKCFRNGRSVIDHPTMWGTGKDAAVITSVYAWQSENSEFFGDLDRLCEAFNLQWREIPDIYVPGASRSFEFTRK